MTDRDCSVIINKKTGEDEIELKMKKRLTESYEDFYKRVMQTLYYIFPYSGEVYKAKGFYHE